MIDLHCHILPGVDDGSSSEEESCRMARLAVESGVTAVCATPHCNVPGCFDNYRTEALEERFLRLARLLRERDIPLRLYAGMEVYVTPETPRHLREGKLLTLGGSRYLLVEFGFEAPVSFAQRMLEGISAAALLACAAAGAGITILPRSQTAEPLRSGAVRELTITDAVFQRTYFLLCHKNKYLTEGMRKAIGIIREVMA